MTDISILGVDAVAGAPDALLSVSAFLRTAAGEVGLVRAALERPAVVCHWEGAAADAFRDLLADTPHDLTRAAASYELAATTMARYAASHRRARDAALVLAQRLAALVDQADGAHGSSRAARRALDAARRSASSDRTTQARERVDDALRSVAAAEDRAVALRAQIEAVQREAHENRRALDGVAAWAAEELRRASHLGLRNSLGSCARRHSGALRAAVDATGDMLGQAATLFKEACDLPGAVIEPDRGSLVGAPQPRAGRSVGRADGARHGPYGRGDGPDRLGTSGRDPGAHGRAQGRDHRLGRP